MKCFNPLTVAHPSYSGEQCYIVVPCRKCAACVQNRINEWANRLITESREPGFHYFVTLTYADEPSTYKKEHIQLFIKNLRKYEKTIRFFVSGERGSENGRIHYHALIFSRNIMSSDVIRSWPFGFSTVSPVTRGRCGYAAKYCCPIPGDEEYFLYVSRKPALGYKLSSARVKYFEETGSTVYHESGTVKPLPRYNRRKLKDAGVVFRKDASFFKQSVRELEDYYRERPNESYDRQSYRQQQQEMYSKKVFNRKKK
ncbi:replication initiator protein [Chifec microvirus UA13_27]|nr:replication initiator protein [Chifec microvirus UA13_27]